MQSTPRETKEQEIAFKKTGNAHPINGSGYSEHRSGYTGSGSRYSSREDEQLDYESQYLEEPTLYKTIVEKGYIYGVGFAVIGSFLLGAPIGIIGGAGVGLALGIRKALKSSE